MFYKSSFTRWTHKKSESHCNKNDHGCCVTGKISCNCNYNCKSDPEHCKNARLRYAIVSNCFLLDIAESNLDESILTFGISAIQLYGVSSTIPL